MIKKKPAISVIVPVLNESGTITEFTEHLMSATCKIPVEIIIADGNSEGSTINHIHDSVITTIVAPRGRGTQMNTGASLANADILLFLHADTILPENAFSMIIEAMGKPGIIAGSFNLGIKSDRFIFKIIASMTSFKHRLTRVPFGDQGIFIQSAFFRDIGGYREIPIMEDLELMRRIKKMKKEIIILPAKVFTSPRKWVRDGIVYTVFRNWILEILFNLGVSPERLFNYYYGTGKK